MSGSAGLLPRIVASKPEKISVPNKSTPDQKITVPCKSARAYVTQAAKRAITKPGAVTLPSDLI